MLELVLMSELFPISAESFDFTAESELKVH